ncbi:MAG: nucleotidyltransferase family protein [Propionivibrio sp.]|nr:nucleotidyltransferase family protein [Propionivibrio sp.]MBK8402085.1 nucleotidyltransferase family protein [Propionivibrio sp.]
MSEAPLLATATLMDAVRAIEMSRRRMAVVVSDEGRLLGTLTDGDIRRCLLVGGSLETVVALAMNPNPLTADWESPDGYLRDLMRCRNVLAVPLLDRAGNFVRMVHLTDLEQGDSIASGAPPGFSFAVIMAGGEGMRLRPLTDEIPKPMVEIGGIPLLARQIERLAKVGIGRVYISVNYLSHIIEEYFGDGGNFGIEICYLHEQEKLGTAGALGLLPEIPRGPIIVMNGDVLTNSDFDSFYAFHMSHGACVTVAAIDHRVEIPYGVIRADGSLVTDLVEKPSERFLCNAGIYALSPAALNWVPEGEFCNMTDIIAAGLTKKQTIAVFPIHEYWSDIGTPDDLEKARNHFARMELVK